MLLNKNKYAKRRLIYYKIFCGAECRRRVSAITVRTNTNNRIRAVVFQVSLQFYVLRG